MSQQINPSQIMQIGMGFFASKTLLSAVELGLFTYIVEKPMTLQEIEKKLGLHHRSSSDFLDTLVALGMLKREGLLKTAVYSNTEETKTFLNKNSPMYLGGILEMANARLYSHWANLTEGLQTGKPQNEIKQAKNHERLFDALYADPVKLEGFLAAMSGIQKGNFMMLAQKFDFTKYGSVCDAGGASGAFSIAVASKHPNVKCITYDLPQVGPIAKRNIDAAGLSKQVTVQDGNFFKDPFPKVNVIAMGNILHDWGLEEKKTLIKKVFDALPVGGCFIAVENVIDDDRRNNAFGLMMSLNMLIETDSGFDYTGAQFKEWCMEAGFKSVEIMPLAGPTSAAIAYK